jgi:hypothetical protein
MGDNKTKKIGKPITDYQMHNIIKLKAMTGNQMDSVL